MERLSPRWAERSSDRDDGDAIFIDSPPTGVVAQLAHERRVGRQNDPGDLVTIEGGFFMPDISYYNKILLIPAIAGSVFTPLSGGRYARLARRLAGLTLAFGAAFLVAVGAALALAGASKALAGATGPHFVLLAVFLVMLPVFILPTAIAEYLGARP